MVNPTIICFIGRLWIILKKFILALCLIFSCNLIYAQPGSTGTACNNFIKKYHIINGGVCWGKDFIQYAQYKGRIIRPGQMSFYHSSLSLPDEILNYVIAVDTRYNNIGSIVYIKAVKDSDGRKIWPSGPSQGRIMIALEGRPTGSCGPYNFSVHSGCLQQKAVPIEAFVIFEGLGAKALGDYSVDSIVNYIRRVVVIIKADMELRK